MKLKESLKNLYPNSEAFEIFPLPGTDRKEIQKRNIVILKIKEYFKQQKSEIVYSEDNLALDDNFLLLSEENYDDNIIDIQNDLDVNDILEVRDLLYKNPLSKLEGFISRNFELTWLGVEIFTLKQTKLDHLKKMESSNFELLDVNRKIYDDLINDLEAKRLQMNDFPEFIKAILKFFKPESTKKMSQIKKMFQIKNNMNLNEISKLEKHDKETKYYLENFDFNIESIFHEVSYLIQEKINKGMFQEEDPVLRKVNDYLERMLFQGFPVNLVYGSDLNVKNNILKTIFQTSTYLFKNFHIVSIIGTQSSAKSSILNALFNCSFESSAGRCTKGVNMSIKNSSTDNRFLVMDTEGLLSVMGNRNKQFDNIVGISVLSVSHIVIINLKGEGEVNKNLLNLLEIFVFGISKMNLKTLKPKLIFIIRDIVDQDEKKQIEILERIKELLIKACSMIGINMDDYIDLDIQSSIFVMPSAFTRGEKIEYNAIFSSKLMKIRKTVFEYFETTNQRSFSDLYEFYSIFSENWENLRDGGKDIVNLKSVHEHEAKMKLLEIFQGILNDEVKKIESNLKNLCTTLINKENFDHEVDLEIERGKKEIRRQMKDAIIQKNIKFEYHDELLILDSRLYERLEWERHIISKEYDSVNSDNLLEEQLFTIKKKVKDIVTNVFKSGRDHTQLKTELDDSFKILSKLVKQQFEVQKENVMKKVQPYMVMLLRSMKRKLLAECQNIQINEKDLEGPVLDITDLEEPESLILESMIIEKHYFYPDISKIAFVEDNQRFSESSKDYFEEWLDSKMNIQESKKFINENLKKFLQQISAQQFYSNPESLAEKIYLEAISQVGSIFTDQSLVNSKRDEILKVFLVEGIKIHSRNLVAAEGKNLEQNLSRTIQYLAAERIHSESMIKLSDNPRAQGEITGKRVLEEIIANYLQGILQRIKRDANEIFLKKFKNSETFNRYVYTQVFEKHPIKTELIPFIDNPVMIISEYFNQEYQIILDTEIRKDIEEETDFQLKKILSESYKYTLEEIQEIQDELALPKRKMSNYILEDMFSVDILQISDSFYTVYGDIISNRTTFTVGIVNEIRKNLKGDLISVGIMKIFNKIADENTLKETLIGCDERCPCCGSKCILAMSDHTNHKTFKHRMLIFKDGCKNLENRKFDTCETVWKENFFWGTLRIKEFFEQNHQEWVQDLNECSAKVNPGQIVPKEQIHAWYILREHFAFKCGYRVDEFPNEWLEQIKKFEENQMQVSIIANKSKGKRYKIRKWYWVFEEMWNQLFSDSNPNL